MNEIVHARLDDETRELMRRLKLQLGRSDSDIVRFAIRALATVELGSRQAPSVIGVGEFSSDVDDLGSNPLHLADFGR